MRGYFVSTQMQGSGKIIRREWVIGTVGQVEGPRRRKISPYVCGNKIGEGRTFGLREEKTAGRKWTAVPEGRRRRRTGYRKRLGYVQKNRGQKLESESEACDWLLGG